MGCGASKSRVSPGNLKSSASGSLGDASSRNDVSLPTGVRTPTRTPNTPFELRLPMVSPPVLRKDSIFDVDRFGEIDIRSLTVPEDFMYGTYQNLVDYLTENAWNDVAKVRAIFRWLTSFDLNVLHRRYKTLPDRDTPLYYLLKIQWNMGNHAHFFAGLCRYANIPCVIVSGVNKSAAYQIGMKIDRLRMAAQWNAVYVDGEWRLLDAFWSSTCVIGRRSGEWTLVDNDGDLMDEEDAEDTEGETFHRVNEFFFLPDPEKLFMTHFPNDPRWQLIDPPETEEMFEDHVYIRERFFDLGLYMIHGTKKKCIIMTEKGEIDIVFGIPPETSAKSQFKYLIYRSKQKGGMRQGTLQSAPLEQYVMYSKSNDTIKYSIRFPYTGVFKIDIFGRDTTKHETFDLISSYLIECPSPKDQCKPLPDCPEIGWGPGIEIESYGLFPKEHTGPVIETKDGMLEIRLTAEEGMSLLPRLKHNNIDDCVLTDHAIVRREDDEVIVSLRLPQQGEYALNLFADQADREGLMDNVCNYIVKCFGVDNNGESQKFPKLHNGTIGEGYLCKKLGITPTTHTKGTIDTKDGNVLIEFQAGNDIDLYAEINHVKIAKHTLNNCVKRSHDGSVQGFQLDLPVAGEYTLNIFATKGGEGASRLYSVYKYLIVSRQEDENMEAIDNNEGGLSPRSPTRLPVVPMEVDKQKVEVRPDLSSGNKSVRLPGGINDLLGELTRYIAHDPINFGDVSKKREATTEVFDLVLPENAEYSFNVYEKKMNGMLDLTRAYQIRRSALAVEPLESEKTMMMLNAEELDPEEEKRRKLAKELEAKHRHYRNKLKDAIRGQNPESIRQAMREFIANDVPDTGQLAKAQRFLDYLKIREELTEAMSRRDLQKLERSIAAAEKGGFQKNLGLQLAMAKKICEQLQRIESYRHEVMKLDSKTIAEIKAYNSPPQLVHDVMAATYLLLGHSESEVEDWRALQALIGRLGKDNLKRRIQEFDVTSLEINVAIRAHSYLVKNNLDEVRNTSNGAAAFYVWSNGMVEEAESRYEQSGGNLSDVRAKIRPKTGRAKHRPKTSHRNTPH